MPTIDEFFYDLPPDEKALCELCRHLILSAADFEEKFSYGVPFYFRYARVCCIWPASSPGGPRHGMFIGFYRGNLLSNEQGIIEMGNRKRYGLIRYRDAKDINREVLLEILQEAILLDEDIWRAKKMRKRGK